MAVSVTTTRNVKKIYKNADKFEIQDGNLVILRGVERVAAYAQWVTVEVEDANE